MAYLSNALGAHKNLEQYFYNGAQESREHFGARVAHCSGIAAGILTGIVSAGCFVAGALYAPRGPGKLCVTYYCMSLAAALPLGATIPYTTRAKETLVREHKELCKLYADMLGNHRTFTGPAKCRPLNPAFMEKDTVIGLCEAFMQSHLAMPHIVGAHEWTTDDGTRVQVWEGRRWSSLNGVPHEVGVIDAGH